jgi:cyclopropane fatty-acyl-phospholipid synthase-like methyltransferase
MAFGRFLFGLFYRLGFTPWEGHALPARLRELADAPSKGKALDVGCGTGDTSIYLARQGWSVTAVDFVEVAVKRAAAKAQAARVKVNFTRADVTQLAASGVGSGFRLIVDNGCFHGLSDEGRSAYVEQISAVASPDATLLIVGFAEGKRRGPRGFNQPELERRFGGHWQLQGSWKDAAISSRPDDPIYVYELRRK